MPTALTHGLPVLLVVAVIVLIYRRTGGHRETYQLSQPWTHQPVLWAATDEVVPARHGDSLTVGGGASGHW